MDYHNYVSDVVLIAIDLWLTEEQENATELLLLGNIDIEDYGDMDPLHINIDKERDNIQWIMLIWSPFLIFSHKQ